MIRSRLASEAQQPLRHIYPRRKRADLVNAAREVRGSGPAQVDLVVRREGDHTSIVDPMHAISIASDPYSGMCSARWQGDENRER
jgi:hypothetical protein